MKYRLVSLSLALSFLALADASQASEEVCYSPLRGDATSVFVSKDGTETIGKYWMLLKQFSGSPHGRTFRLLRGPFSGKTTKIINGLPVMAHAFQHRNKALMLTSDDIVTEPPEPIGGCYVKLEETLNVTKGTGELAGISRGQIVVEGRVFSNQLCEGDPTGRVNEFDVISEKSELCFEE